MGKDMELHGTVLEGDFKGCNVYRRDSDSFMIGNGKISTKLFSTPFTELKRISKATVDHYVEISSNSQKNHPNAAIVGFLSTLSGTPIGTAEHDIAIYFKDGKKCVIRLYFDSCYNDIRRILFTL